MCVQTKTERYTQLRRSQNYFGALFTTQITRDMGMFSNPKLRSFVNRNLVAIVMIPGLIGIHWGWLRLQSVEEFVPKEERKGLPIVRLYYKLKDEAVHQWFPEKTPDKPSQE